ncbi:MAG: signal recognition particle-docking protein FtsY [Candidatus Micrarchaeota archaeon]|nr:signal recognition particle-docking protein FtsY [Candidatus Micrarchaeota archaeon]
MFDGLKKRLSNVVKSFIRIEEEKVEQPTEQKPEESKQPEVHEEPEAVITKPIGREEKPKVPEHEIPRHEARPVPQPQSEKAERQEQRKEEKQDIKLSFTTKIKGAIFSKIRLNDSEIDSFLENLKVSMLESDVSYETTEIFLDDMRRNLKSAELNSRNISSEITGQVRKSLFQIMETEKKPVDMIPFVQERAHSAKPVRILFLGPNGAGKTTTIAKIAHALKDRKMSVVLSASDTFRAAAIEQMEYHAHRLGVPVIKSGYGSDPASVAFDAIAYAKARAADVVLIDSAGRQETNKNLISEMQKMHRVTQPDLTVFVCESISGNALSGQIREFAKHIRIDGIILTKLDCDAKGGNVISIARATGIPVLMFGTGEAYDALVPYSAEFIVDSIIPAS